MSTPQFWGSDAPNVGAYREHEVIPVFRAAAFASVLFQMADKRQIASGQSLTIPAYENLDFPATTSLDEDQPIPLSKLNITAKTIEMDERGRAISVTGRTQRRSPFDVLEAHQTAIAEMMSREMEEVISTALKTMPIKYVPTGAANQNVTTNGTPGAVAANNINVYHLQNIGTLLSDTYRVPVDPRTGCYMGLFRGPACLALKRDPDWFELHRGTALESIADFAVGKIGEVMIMKHNDDRVLANNLGTPGNVSEGFVMGHQAVLFGFLEQIGLRFDFSEDKATDFGRFKYIAWYGDYGAGIYSDSANADLVRGLHVTSLPAP